MITIKAGLSLLWSSLNTAGPDMNIYCYEQQNDEDCLID